MDSYFVSHNFTHIHTFEGEEADGKHKKKGVSYILGMNSGLFLFFSFFFSPPTKRYLCGRLEETRNCG